MIKYIPRKGDLVQVVHNTGVIKDGSYAIVENFRRIETHGGYSLTLAILDSPLWNSDDPDSDCGGYVSTIDRVELMYRPRRSRTNDKLRP